MRAVRMRFPVYTPALTTLLLAGPLPERGDSKAWEWVAAGGAPGAAGLLLGDTPPVHGSLRSATTLLANGLVTTVACGAATFVGLSRIEAKEHRTSDVVAGAILGMEPSPGLEPWMGARSGDRREDPEGGSGPVVYLGVGVPVR